MSNSHNYSITLGYKDPDKGYVRAGFEEFSTYYDLSGGYFAGNGQFIDLYKQTGEIDRQKVFFEAGLTLENKPQVRIRYEYDKRDGTKNSTEWGDTGLIGIPGQIRKSVPSLNAGARSLSTASLSFSTALRASSCISSISSTRRRSIAMSEGSIPCTSSLWEITSTS